LLLTAHHAQIPHRKRNKVKDAAFACLPAVRAGSAVRRMPAHPRIDCRKQRQLVARFFGSNS
jgi:hypothetical protein